MSEISYIRFFCINIFVSNFLEKLDRLYEKDFLLNKLCEIDESNGNKYQEEISSFIIKKSDDKKNNRVFKFS